MSEMESLFERMPDNPEITKDGRIVAWSSVRGHQDAYQQIVWEKDENGDDVQMIRIVQKNATTGGWDETRYVMRDGTLVEKSVEIRNASGVRLSGSIMGNTTKLDPVKALANEAIMPTRTTITFRPWVNTDPSYNPSRAMVSETTGALASDIQFEPRFDVWNALTGDHLGSYVQSNWSGDPADGRNYTFHPELRRAENLESLLPGFDPVLKK